MRSYDVIIVGAGVSGLMLAHYLKKTSLRFVVLEKKPHLHVEPERFGTFTEVARRHKLASYITTYFDTWAFYGPTTRAARTRKRYMCLVDYDAWARDQTFPIKHKILLKKAAYTPDGIVLTDHNKRQFHGKLVVDATGHTQIVKRLLGLPVNEETGLCYEVELKGCKRQPQREASFILNFDIGNSGGWHYAISHRKAQFGWADFLPEAQSTVRDLKQRVRKARQHLDPHRHWLRDAEVTYAYGRCGPSGQVDHEVFDRVIAIGDAGGCGTPVTLEGFREAIESGYMAYQTIRNAKDYHKEDLQPFLERFHARYGRYYRIQHLVRHIYLHYVRNEDIDRWITNFTRFRDRDFFKLIRGEHTLLLMLRTLDPILAGNLLLNLLNNVLPSSLQFRPPITPSKREQLCK